MNNKKLMIGIATGAAVLAGAAVLIARNRSKRKYEAQVSDARSNFSSKLNELKRKAQKEYKNSPSELKDTVNAAKDRATDWANQAKA